MRPCVLATTALAMFFCATARAEFVLKFDSEAKLFANTPDQILDLYLTSDTSAFLASVSLRAYLGSNGSVLLPPAGTLPPSYDGSEGNFEKSALYPGGVEATGPGYFFNNPTVNNYPFSIDSSSPYGNNVTSVNIVSVGTPVPLNLPVKIATFHIDTTGFFGPDLTIGLSHDEYFGNSISNRTTATTADPLVPRSGTQYYVGNGITTQEGVYALSSTPEPSVIGFAGLGLAAGVGWLRARRRKAAQ